jgi:leucine dehydrogenase
VVTETGATVISEQELYNTPADVYAPCALGATLNPDTIGQLQVGVVAGAANNQLLDEARDGQALVDRDILYAPDFLINSGGLINVYGELEGYNRERAMERAEGIYTRLMDIFRSAEEQGIPTQLAAVNLAQERIQAVGRIKQFA